MKPVSRLLKTSRARSPLILSGALALWIAAFASSAALHAAPPSQNAQAEFF